MVSEIITSIIVILMFIGLIAWIFVMVRLVLGKLGLWKWATYRRLKKKYKDFEFRDDALDWCLDKIVKQWEYKDVRRFVKHEKNGDELLYTFILLKKLNAEELAETIERRTENGGKDIIKPEEQVERTLPEIPKESGE